MALLVLCKRFLGLLFFEGSLGRGGDGGLGKGEEEGWISGLRGG